MGSSGSSGKANVENYINTNPVMVFSKTYCPFCTRTKELLKRGGVPFVIVEMDTMRGGSALHSALKKFSGQSSVPNIYIGGKHIGGNDNLQELARSGNLKRQLDELKIQNTF